MANAELSLGYKALAQGLVYDFKDTSGELKNQKWTPHNIKTLIVTAKGIIVRGYSSELPVIKGSSKLISFSGRTSSDYTGMFLALFKLGNSLSANVSNVRDIIVAFGAGDFAVPFSSPEEFMQITGYANSPDSKTSLESYSATSSIFSLPTISFVSCNDIWKDYVANERISELKVATVKALLSRTPLNMPAVYLQERDGEDLRWDVIPESRFIERNERQSAFPLTDTRTAFTKLSNLISDADILNKYAGALHLQVKSYNYTPDTYDIEKFDTNKGNYAADGTLRRYMHDNYYKPLAVLHYLLDKKVSDVDVKKLTERLTVANELLQKLCSGATLSNARTNRCLSAWTPVISQANLWNVFKLCCKDAKITVDDKVSDLFIQYLSAELPADVGISVHLAVVDAFVLSVIYLAQAAAFINMFAYGFTPGETVSPYYFKAVATALQFTETDAIYIENPNKTVYIIRVLLRAKDTTAGSIQTTVARLLNSDNKLKNVADVSGGVTRLAQLKSLTDYVTVMLSGI